MDKQQAEAVAQAILEPHLQRQAVAHRKRASKAQALTRMRRLGLWLIPVGGVAGSLVSYFAGLRLFDGIWRGALAGVLLTQAVVWLRTGRHR